MQRPIAVTIMAILAVISGLVAVLDVLRHLGLLPIAMLSPLNFFWSEYCWRDHGWYRRTDLVLGSTPPLEP
jgi:hypothetical protein